MRDAAKTPFSLQPYVRVSLLVWVSLSFLGGDCMPTGREAAGAVLMASPAAFLLGLLLLFVLRKVWAPLYEPDARNPASNKPLLGAFSALLALALFGYFVDQGAAEWALVALLAFGTSYNSILLVVWRIWFHKQKSASFFNAPLVTIAVLLLPAPMLLAGNFDRNTAEGMYMIPWMLPGLFGYVTVPLFLVLLGEAIVRRVLKSRNAEGAENAPKE